MSGTSLRKRQNVPKAEDDQAARWKRVGEFVRARRAELGMSQGDMIVALGYKTRSTISNVEVGVEGLPPKRAYAWADVLEIPRGAFYEFVTGARATMDLERDTAPTTETTAAERELLASYRRLPPKFQRRLRETALELETLARAERRG